MITKASRSKYFNFKPHLGYLLWFLSKLLFSSSGFHILKFIIIIIIIIFFQQLSLYHVMQNESSDSNLLGVNI